MTTCGIDINGSKAIFTFLRGQGSEIVDVTGSFTQLVIKNHESCDEIRSFFETIKNHFNSINPDKIGIIKRNKSGSYAGGPLSFKIEGLIQLSREQNNVDLISPITLRNFQAKKSPVLSPKYKYQNESYLLALYLLGAL